MKACVKRAQEELPRLNRAGEQEPEWASERDESAGGELLYLGVGCGERNEKMRCRPSIMRLMTPEQPGILLPLQVNSVGFVRLSGPEGSSLFIAQLLDSVVYDYQAPSFQPMRFLSGLLFQ